MPSARETYKQILTKNTDTQIAGIYTSTPQNVQGRDKATFLVAYVTGNPLDTARMTIEWSYNSDPNDWFPLPEAKNILVNENTLKRISVDDVSSYLRLRVDAFSAVGKLSAWSIAL